MLVLAGIVLGAIVGAVLAGENGALLGMVLGGMAAVLHGLATRLQRLEAAVRDTARTAASTVVVRPAGRETYAPAPVAVEAPEPVPAAVPERFEIPAAAPDIRAASAPFRPLPVEEPEWQRRLRALVFGGNTAVRAGVVVLFFGVAFLLKYAVEHSLLPIELRLTGAALGGIALLVAGWRLRAARAGYALTLQGGGIGILYLTVFAALRLYQLLPAEGAFALLVAVVVASALLALRQDSLALAVLGATGGFLAPVLTSTGGGNHVLLFGYYALLNAGILAVGVFRAWRVLNLVGFAFTFVIGASWGWQFYRPELFTSTEPFLAWFFLNYVAIAVLFALRQPPDLRGLVDGTLVFGVPIVGALLQAALVRDFEYGLAWSALALGFFYLALAAALLRRAPDSLRTLVEAFLALGVVFATLAIPLALDGRWTAAAWAVEGAGIAWVGVRQQRLSARLFGAFLVFAAGVSFLGDRSALSGWPVLNARYTGSLLVSLAALISAQVFQRGRERLYPDERPLALALLVWGLLWWYGAGLDEIGRQISGDRELAVMGLFVALSCLAAEYAGRRFAWPALRASSALLWPALALLLAWQAAFFAHPFAHAGYLAWLPGLATGYFVLRRQEADAAAPAPHLQHAVAFWLATALAGLELAWAMGTLVSGGRDWSRLAWGLVPAAALAVSAGVGRWPPAAQRATYLTLGAAPVAAVALLWVVHTSITSRGEPAPLAYLPLLNPLDLASAFLGLALGRWLLALRALERPLPAGFWPGLLGVCAATGFVWLNAMLFRSLHHYAGIDYRLAALVRSVLAQAAVSLAWSALALALVTLATRLRNRLLWLAGAALLGVVVVKLFLVDLAGTGTMARIVSFLGVGLLLLVIGYLSPVPPRAERQEVAP